MKLLIIGGLGLVGWNMVNVACKQEYEVSVTCNSHPIDRAIPWNLDEEPDLDSLFEYKRPDAVINCAAWSWVDGCESDPGKAFLRNRDQPRRLAECAKRYGCQFVHFCSSYVFDGADGPYDEGAVPNPINVYGESKLAGELAVQEAIEGTAIVAGTMGVYGIEPKQKNFVYQVIKKLKAGEVVHVPSDQYGNASYAPDLANWTLGLLEKEQFGIWNLAGERPNLCSLKFAQAYEFKISYIVGLPTSELNQRARRPQYAGLDCNRLLMFTKSGARDDESMLEQMNL